MSVDDKNKTRPELEKMLAEKRTALRHFQFGVSGGKVTDVKAGRNLRREIARLLTFLRVK